MIRLFLSSIILIFVITLSEAQTAMQFSGLSCQGDSVDLFSDLDSGKAVLLHFFMPNCGTCPPPAQKIQKMANKINAVFPGKVKGYAFPFENSYSCIVASNWVATSNVSTLYTPMDSGEAQVAHYGGFGMPTVVLLGGADHRILFSTQSFTSSDTTILRDSVLALFGTANGIQDLPGTENSFSLYPNPARNFIAVEFETQISSAELKILNILGETVLFENRQNFTRLIADISQLNAGIYFLQVMSSNESYTQKFIKK